MRFPSSFPFLLANSSFVHLHPPSSSSSSSHSLFISLRNRNPSTQNRNTDLSLLFSTKTKFTKPIFSKPETNPFNFRSCSSKSRASKERASFQFHHRNSSQISQFSLFPDLGGGCGYGSEKVMGLSRFLAWFTFIWVVVIVIFLVICLECFVCVL